MRQCRAYDAENEVQVVRVNVRVRVNAALSSSVVKEHYQWGKWWSYEGLIYHIYYEDLCNLCRMLAVEGNFPMSGPGSVPSPSPAMRRCEAFPESESLPRPKNFKFYPYRYSHYQYILYSARFLLNQLFVTEPDVISIPLFNRKNGAHNHH